MHYRFKIGLDKVDSLSAPNFLPEEIDVFLNDAQDQLIAQKAFNNNTKKEGLEETQKRVDDLKNIITNYNTVTFTTNASNKPNGVFVNLPSNYRHAIQEEAIVTYTDCNNQTTTINAEIIPLSHDRYNRIIRDPFNVPSTEIVYRLGYEVNLTNEVFELLHAPNTIVSNYILRYIRIPQEIRYGTVYQTPTTDLDCELSEHTHREIVALAVKNALEEIESPRYQTSKIELRDIE
jgi:hypothetical protein